MFANIQLNSEETLLDSAAFLSKEIDILILASKTPESYATLMESLYWHKFNHKNFHIFLYELIALYKTTKEKANSNFEDKNNFEKFNAFVGASYFQGKIADKFYTLLNGLDQGDLTHLIAACAEFNICEPDLLEDISFEIHKKLKNFTQQNLVRITRALAHFGIKNPFFKKQLIHSLLEVVIDLNHQEYIEVLRAVQKLRITKPL